MSDDHGMTRSAAAMPENSAASERLVSEVTALQLSASSIPYWFAAIAGVIYAIGFLVEFTFFGSMGIKMTATDAFKAKYIYVGLLCLLPTIAAVFAIACFRLWREKQTPVYFSSIFLVLTILLDFYLLVAFAPATLFRDKEPLIFITFCCAIPALTATRILQDAIQKSRSRTRPARLGRFLAKTFLTEMRWKYIRRTLFAATAILSVIIFLPVWPLLIEILLQGGWLYLGFCAVIVVNLTYLASYKPGGWMLIAGLCIPIAFAYLATLAFAYRIYPYIPVERGGGDYSRESNVSVLSFNPELNSSIPDELLAKGASTSAPPANESIPLTILDEAGGSVFVTPEVSQQDHVRWRELGPQTKPKIIYAIRPEQILWIRSTREILEK